MKYLWRASGRVAFWLSWPLLYFYLRWSHRTRVLIICDNHIVVTKGWLGNGRWALPGGGTHDDETAKQGAVRETYEETGIILKENQLTLLGSAIASSYGLSFKYEKFFTKLPEKLPLKPQRFEITDAIWIPIAELNSKNAENVTLDTITSWKQRA